MPKGPVQKGRAKASRVSPTKPIAKNPKLSHLYTDDNPSTTIHGTGFKDKAAAEKTLDLIKKRSLIYQFQTVNTMYNRAKHHPAMKKAVDGAASTADMRAAMGVFREWLDVSYPAARESQRANGFKPLLNKKLVAVHLDKIQEAPSISDDAKVFARVYAFLPRGKKLGNVLVDQTKPMEQDWEAKRYSALCELVLEGDEDWERWAEQQLFKNVDGGDVMLTEKHLHFIAWAWSPVPKRIE